MFKDETGAVVPATVTAELRKTADAVLRRRSENVKNRQSCRSHSVLLTGKLLRTHCGTFYDRRGSKDIYGSKSSKRVCSEQTNNALAV